MGSLFIDDEKFLQKIVAFLMTTWACQYPISAIWIYLTEIPQLLVLIDRDRRIFQPVIFRCIQCRSRLRQGCLSGNLGKDSEADPSRPPPATWNYSTDDVTKKQ